MTRMGANRRAKIPAGAWYVAFMFFLFLLLHNADKFLISPVLSQIEAEFGLSYTELGLIGSGTVVVAVLFMPFWGYVFDKFARPPLVALASAVWGITTILSTFSANFSQLFLTRAMTGIDNEATSGIISFLGDYFPPERRATAIGLVNTSTAFGTLLGVIVGTVAGESFGWRTAFLITAVPALLLAAVVLFTVKDRPRGSTEPELADVKDRLTKTFSTESLKRILGRRSIVMLYAQGFFGVFPWQILSYWLLLYMEKVRGYTPDKRLLVMAVALLAMAAGNVAAGLTSDWAFRRSLRGRVVFAGIAVAAGLVLFDAAILARDGLDLFIALAGLTAFVIPMAGPNVSASIQDISLPEVRSTALSLGVFFENLGSASAPLLTGCLADAWGLEQAIVAIVTVTWALCALLFFVVAAFIPLDIIWKREQLAERARLLAR